jgi:hypothetical protein
MGFNTTLVLMNDALSSIENDTELGKKIASAVLELSIRRPVDIAAGGHVNAITALETHHADGLVPVLIGGNHGYPLPLSIRWATAPGDMELELLKRLADKHGYNLRKKASR